MELTLENIVMEINLWQHKLEACLSSEVGASYHNMQKVCHGIFGHLGRFLLNFGAPLSICANLPLVSSIGHSE